jgi:hypothetical protein
LAFTDDTVGGNKAGDAFFVLAVFVSILNKLEISMDIFDL